MDTHETPDNELLRGCRNGDEAAFAELYSRYRRQLFTFLNRMVPGRPEVADDLFQQTWIKVLDGLDAYREQQKFISWLFRIAHNLAIDHFRQNRRFTELAEDFDPADDSAAPGETIDREILLAGLETAVAKLPPEQREVVLLRQQQVPFSDIAGIQGVSVNTVLGRMHYAVGNLRKLLAAGGLSAATKER